MSAVELRRRNVSATSVRPEQLSLDPSGASPDIRAVDIDRTISAAIAALSPARLRRAIAMLMVGILVCSPLVVFAAGAEAEAMSSDMMMESASAAMDGMPCHEDKSDAGKGCPSMAICMALCCQALTVSHVMPATPVALVSRMLPLEPARLDGIKSPPPSRPPKA
jgi:hypothetical protein